jgi:hypothetical protein
MDALGSHLALYNPTIRTLFSCSNVRIAAKKHMTRRLLFSIRSLWRE